MAPENRTVSFYHYDPSEAAAAVFCALFGLSLIYSTFMVIRTGAWVWTVQLVAILMEVVGYVSRIASAQRTDSLDLYAVQFCVIILAPVLMAGVVYVVFGRIVFHVVPEQERTTRLLWVPARWITPIFVTFDIVSLVIQLLGAIVVSSTKATDENAVGKLETGKNVALVGLAVQMAAFGLFSVIAVRFHFTSKRFEASLRPGLEGSREGKKAAVILRPSREINPHWRHLLYVINGSCLLILARSIFRIVEFAEGPSGRVMQEEYFMYVLDTLPMFLVVFSFTIFFPGTYLPFMGFRVPKHPAGARELPGENESAIALREV
ncbi:RTA1-domain-containing protein [Durotheca rogersii]|uniref:RTA1-domain-containing protein n=1 Tax=Durotheca rogersii TaxID=419775 RepID=UPI00221F9DC6|nr:RTA1-domain-containing protein [Durotheca rogersii]KAI5863234.1 RTA1-domain-containing protein [Durotheca rogersii]